MHKPKKLPALLLLAFPLVGNAQQATDNAQNTAADAGEPALQKLVVTAQRREQTAQEVPAALSVIKGQDLGGNGDTFLGDAIKFVPNAAAQKADGDTRPRWYIRGLGTGDVGVATVFPTGIYADDVYLNAPIAGGVALFDLNRIEVLRGPQGTLYGKNTTAGAVNILSNKPVFENGGYLTLGAGTKKLRTIEGAVNGKVSDTLAIRASFYNEERDGFTRNPLLGERVGDVDKQAYRLQFLFKPTQDFDALLKIHSRTYDGDGNNGSLPIGTYAGGYQRPSGRILEANYPGSSELEHDGASATLNYRFGGGYQFTSITAFDTIKNKTFADGDNTPSVAPLADQRTFGDAKYEQASQEFRLASPKEELLRWIVGAHYFQEDIDSVAATSNLTTGAPRYQQTTIAHDTRSFALFGNLTYDFTEKFSTTAGLRWTREKKDLDISLLTYQTATGFNTLPWWRPDALINPVLSGAATANGTRSPDDTWSAWTFDITPEYRVTDKILTFFRYARGFRSGGFNTGIGGNLDTASTVKPEFLDSYEIGVKTEWLNGRLFANANVFYYDYSDIQVNQLIQNPFGIGVVSALTNGAKGKVTGFELDVTARPIDALVLRGTLGLLDTEYTDFGANTGNVFVRSPKLNAALGAEYTFGLANGGRLIAAADASYRSREYFLVDRQSQTEFPDLTQEGFSLFNARLSYLTPDQKIRVTGYVDNITDELYQNHGRPNGPNGSGRFIHTYGSPRTVGLTVTTRF
ncbi:MAG: TonB-dependent receptor [Methyloversatilis discipulorum]|uniref:TonB-dependent receptor n=1 Tax=Methyloversatilis discipulorum TaxID=1119528 RepID=UPI0026F2E2D2|nr:TonB-dependent receptor [Methyloversatilis discipulorum]MBT9516027.1 TonB-dependent receptor [Methyloversatilis discipulorum]